MLDETLRLGVEAVEKRLSASIDSDVETLHDASLHIIESGGKRVRPRVAMLAYIASGGQDVLDVVDAAAAVEMIHTASLVHDDINDHSALRRGQVSVHKRWGRTFALLTGDYMFTKVYELMAPYGVEPNKVMAHAAKTLVEGETLQARAAKAGEMDRETYKQVIERKTASLFIAAAELGAVIAGGDENVRQALSDYGKYLGNCFQIVDDILDLIGDPEEMGKPKGLDVSQNRGVAVAHGNRVDNNGHVAVMEDQTDDPVERMLQKLRESGAVDVARMEADRMADKAREALSKLQPSPAVSEMAAIVDEVLDRKM